MGQEKVVCIGVGSCCGCCGALAIIIAWTAIAGIVQTIYDIVEDMQHIDSPFDGNENPLAESKQFETWEERDDGSYWSYSVFTVTNAESAVVNGQTPRVTERGPINLVQFSRKLIDQDQKDAWALDGIARYRTQKMNYINNDTCDAACLALLDTNVVIPNPVWATFASRGLETPLILLLWLASLQTQAVAAGVPAANIAAWSVGQLMGASNTANGISATQDEASAILSLAAGPMSTVGKIGALALFLQGAQAAAQGAASGCTLAGFGMVAQRCGVLLNGLVLAAPANGKIGPTWQTIMTNTRPAYGTGMAAPVFIRRPAKRILAYGGGFVDPMTNLAVNLPAALDYENPTNIEGKQMGSRYGEAGTDVFVMYNGVGTDCRVDVDCCPGGQCSMLATQDACAANPPANCNPLTYMHRSAATIPGANFGKGSSNFPVGTKYDVLINGVSVEFQIVEEGEDTVEGKPLKYLLSRMSKVHRRLENCAGTGADSPGLDCSGPLGTFNYAPQQGGAPLYVALPMFDQTLQEDAAGQNAGQIGGWDPATRVMMTYCTGNSWCDENRPEKFRSYLKIEPETGKTYEASIAVLVTQMTQPSSLQPNVPLAAIPVFLYDANRGASQDQREKLADLQVAPDFFKMICIALTIAGIAGLLLGFACCGFGAYKAMKPVAEDQWI